ncbi:glycoside hydrolase [Mycobacterium sp. OAS707]|uniref:glycoside hydrolase n=1 Tax=Mycobacterium sp. OAS707 TaxID=2663822 RepID=UPI001CEF26D2|nr:glycoside hydrolase [Mycobacterium sp. OAS707]
MSPNCVRNGSTVLLVHKKLLADGRGRWLALAASITVAGGMLYVQNSEHAHSAQPSCCAPTPAAASVPASPELPPPGAPKLATPAEAQVLAASAPATPATALPFELPPGVAPENGLQVDTIRVARAISVLFPQITTIGGWRQDALKWHPEGLAIDVMIPNPDSPEGIDLGNQIAGFALANAQRWDIDDVIWRHAIYLGPKSGQYMPEMGSETANHYDHVHIATNGGGYPTGNEKYFI